jgi:hypothetical protein
MMIARRNRQFFLLAAVILIAGCGSSERKEGIHELETRQAEVHGLHILVSAGVTKQEYSQRLEDVLLQLGDSDQSARQTLPKLSRDEQETVKTVYAHLSQSIEAYELARTYFGDNFEGYGCEDGCSFFPENQYDAAKQEFPTIAALSFGPESTWYRDGSGNIVNHAYRRSDMLRALWSVAGDEDDEAKQLVDQLNQK